VRDLHHDGHVHRVAIPVATVVRATSAHVAQGPTSGTQVHGHVVVPVPGIDAIELESYIDNVVGGKVGVGALDPVASPTPESVTSEQIDPGTGGDWAAEAVAPVCDLGVKVGVWVLEVSDFGA
jgi:hypothetical protein